MREFMSRFFHDDSGATAIEYGLIAAGIAVAIIAAVNAALKGAIIGPRSGMEEWSECATVDSCSASPRRSMMSRCLGMPAIMFIPR